MSEWVSSREALRLAKKEGVDREDLIEWARLGRIGTRARSGQFSDDDPPEERLFPEKPPIDGTERSTRGPWPDIPKEFWAQDPKKAAWAAGTFASRTTFWNDHYEAEDYVFIELRGVSFNRSELEALLKDSAEPDTRPNMPRITWRRQRVTPRQALAMKFIDWITRPSTKEIAGKSERYRMYCEWHKKQSGQQNLEPLGRTDFNKCADRYDDGWRIDGSKWVHQP